MGWAKKNVPGYSQVSKAVIDPISKPLEKAATTVLQPIEKAIVQPVSAGLASLDKSVGKAIPGGWGTVASIAGSAMGLPTPALVGLGALNGSGVMRKGGSFNLQGAMMGGAMAYASAELGDYLRGAVPDVPTVDTYGNLTSAVPNVAPATDGISSLYNSTGGFGQIASEIPQSAINTANAVTAAAQNINPATGLQYGSILGDTLSGNVAPPQGIMSNIMSGNIGDAVSQIGSNIGSSASNAYDSLANFGEKAITPSTYTEALSGYGDNISKTGEGIKNLFGAGDMSSKAASQLASATAKASGTMSPALAAGATLYGATGLMALEEQRKYLEESKAANAISQAEYDSALAEINRSEAVARKAVADNPFNTNPDRSVPVYENTYDTYAPDETLYARLTGEERLYKEGGEVKGYFFGGTIGPAVIEALKNSTTSGGLAAGTPVGFQNLKSEGMPTPIPETVSAGLGGLANAAKAAAAVGNSIANRYEVPNLGQTLYERQTPETKLGVGSLPSEPIPYGIIPPSPNSMNVQALSSFYNPEIDREFIAPTGGYIATPDSGYFAGTNPRLGKTIYRKNRQTSRLYAVGGPIDDESGMDEARGLYQGNMSNGFMGGGMPSYAAGGQPRFLSGGGDGMSDSIKASINGTQEARLADGEFVIPADVVSHLGNGSSKAGAKQLYSMMDKVRSARTGTKKQGKQINPRKYLPA